MVNKYISDFFLPYIKIKDIRKQPDTATIVLQKPFEIAVNFSKYTISSTPYWKLFANLNSDIIFYTELSHTTIVSKGIVVTSNKEVILESTIFQLEYLNELYSNHFVKFNYLLPYKRVNKVFPLLNDLDNNYYHWTMESLSRVLLVYKSSFFKGYKILIKEGGSSFMLNSLKFLFNLSENEITTKPLLKNVKSKKTLVVSFPHIRNKNTNMTNVYYPYLIRELNALAHKRVLEHLNVATSTPPTPKNIIISRKKALERRIVNEDEFVNKLKEYDFVSVQLENLSYVEQVLLFYNAKTVIATHGAGITNVLYGNNLSLIELYPKERIIRDAFYFTQITAALQFKHEVILYNSCNLQQDITINDAVFQQVIEKLKKE